MRIVVFGPGAVGCWYGGLLAQAGYDVTFIARGTTLEHLRKHPMELRDPNGTTMVAPKIAASLAEISQADLVIWATKTLNKVQLPDALPEGAVVMTVQNSVEMPVLAIEAFGASRVIPAVVRGFFTNEGPGKVFHDGGIQKLTFGSVDPATIPLVTQVEEALSHTPITAEVHPDIMADIWTKAMFVSTFGALGAAVDQPLGVVRTTYRGSLENLMREVADTAQATGVRLPADVVDQVLAFSDQQAGTSTSSMQRDLKAGRPNELDAQVGAVLRMARRAKLRLPAHELLFDILSSRLA